MVVAGLLLVGALAGCGSTAGQGTPNSASDGAGQSFTGYSSAMAEYRATEKDFALPAGKSYPTAWPGHADQGGSYQVGYGRMQAVTFWHCAWGKQWLQDLGGDQKKADAAFKEYAAFVNTDVFKNTYDPDSAQPFVRDAIARAELGDPSKAQQDITANCPDE